MAQTIKPIVHLRLYKGSQMSYDANGNVLNENQLVKLRFDTLEWVNYLKNLPSSGFSAAKLEKCLNEKGETIETPSEVETQVKNVFTKKEVEQTPEQKQIAELTARLDAALGKKDDVTSGGVNLLDDLRKEYKDLSGEEADKRWKENKLVEAIDEIKNKKVE